MTIDVDALVRGTLRPERPRLAEARAAVAGTTTAQEALDALIARGLLSAEWVHDANRTLCSARVFFECEECGARVPADGEEGRYCFSCQSMDCLEEVTVSEPLTPAACMTLGAAPEGFASAEALSRELVGALAAFGGTPPPGIAWHVVPRHLVASAYLGLPPPPGDVPSFGPVTYALYAALAYSTTYGLWQKTQYLTANKGLGSYQNFVLDLFGCVKGALLWEQAVSEGAIVPSVIEKDHNQHPLNPPCRPACAGVAFRQLENPYSKRLSLWMTGYHFGYVGEAIHLLAPEVEDTP